MEVNDKLVQRLHVGEVTRNGGISRVARDAQDGLLTILYKNNEPIAAIMPCDRHRETIFTSQVVVTALTMLGRSDSHFGDRIVQFLQAMIAMGSTAQEMLRMIQFGGDIEGMQSDFLKNANGEESNFKNPFLENLKGG